MGQDSIGGEKHKETEQNPVINDDKCPGDWWVTNEWEWGTQFWSMSFNRAGFFWWKRKKNMKPAIMSNNNAYICPRDCVHLSTGKLGVLIAKCLGGSVSWASNFGSGHDLMGLWVWALHQALHIQCRACLGFSPLPPTAQSFPQFCSLSQNKWISFFFFLFFLKN